MANISKIKTLNGTTYDIKDAKAIHNGICPYYSTSETYAVGDKVRYNDNIYECITAIPTAENWTAAHWKIAPTLQEQMTVLNSIVDSSYVEIAKNVVLQNGYINTSGKVISSSLSGYALVPLLKGERVVVGTTNRNITIIGSTTAESVSVGDSVNIIQITGTTSNVFETHEYIAPNDMTVVICVLLSNYSLAFYRYAPARTGLHREYVVITLNASGYAQWSYKYTEVTILSAFTMDRVVRYFTSTGDYWFFESSLWDSPGVLEVNKTIGIYVVYMNV